MARVVHRYFWIVTIASVILCGGLAARAANHVVEGSLLGESGIPSGALDDPRLAPPSSARPAASRDKDGAALVERNMFCADCAPSALEPVEVAAGADGEIPVTGLPIQLVATNLSSRPKQSFATLRNTQTDGQGAYWLGDAIPGAGPIERIAGAFVVFHNPQTNRLERATLQSGKTPAVARATPAAGAGKTAAAGAFADQVRQVEDTTWEVDRDLVAQAIANPMRAGVRIRPVQKDGELEGLRMYGVRASSAPYAIGLRNGDTIHAVNGQRVSMDPSEMLALYTKLKESSSISVEISRRGATQTFNYHLR